MLWTFKLSFDVDLLAWEMFGLLFPYKLGNCLKSSGHTGIYASKVSPLNGNHIFETFNFTTFISLPLFMKDG